MIAFWLRSLPCTVFISVECLQRWGAMLSFVVSVLCNFYQLSSNFIISKVLTRLPDDRNSIARFVCELCFMRDGSFWLSTSFLTTDEVNSLISYACRMY